MRPRKMRSKKASTCTQCGEQIKPGQMIYWARGAGAYHVDCERSAQQAQTTGPEYHPCWNCDSQQGQMRKFAASTPVLCDPCWEKFQDAHDIRRKWAREDNSGHEDRECGDMAYEDACARACGM